MAPKGSGWRNTTGEREAIPESERREQREKQILRARGQATAMASQHSSSYNGSPVDSEPPSQGLVDSEPPSQELPYEEVDSPGRDTDPGEFEAEAGYGHKHWDPQLPVDPAQPGAAHLPE